MLTMKAEHLQTKLRLTIAQCAGGNYESQSLLGISRFFYALGEQNYEDIELPDDYTEEEIEREVKEVALEHFGWSYGILTEEKK